mgnify:CR=1 FL=1
MPIIRIPSGYKYGKHGKRYYGAGAREKARKQGSAIKLSQLRAKGENIPIKGDNKKRGTIRRI